MEIETKCFFIALPHKCVCANRSIIFHVLRSDQAGWGMDIIRIDSTPGYNLILDIVQTHSLADAEGNYN